MHIILLYLIKKSNKFIMKVTNERNIYLKRLSASTPHKYS